MQNGHNEQGVFMDHYRRIAAQKEEVDKAQKQYRKLRKEAKADGITLRDMDFALRCANTDDGDIILGDMQRQVQIAAWFGLPVNTQANLFPEDYDPDEGDIPDEDTIEADTGQFGVGA